MVHRSAPVDAVLVLALEIDLGAEGIARPLQGVKPHLPARIPGRPLLSGIGTSALVE